MQRKWTAEQLAVVEKGRVLNSTNETLLKQVAKHIATVLASLSKGAKADDSEEEDTEDTKEAGTFNQTDTYTLLQAALSLQSGTSGYDTYISDIYEDDKYMVYRKGYNGGYWRVDFDVSDDGTVTLGSPASVVRKVTYLQPTANTEAADIEITGDVISLVEKAVKDDGTVMLKLIAPGWGSSGYYSEEVLKRDGPKVFKAGMHNFVDHPTPEEEQSRPEGSLAKLGSTLIEDARWYDDYNGEGKGLYAAAATNPMFASTLDVIAPKIGTSIRAYGKARKGTAEGRQGNIIEALTGAKSVDYVTVAGAGGKVITLVESARVPSNTTGDEEMSAAELEEIKKQMREMQQHNARLQEALHLQSAAAIVQGELRTYNLPAPTMQRLQEALAPRYVLTEAGTIDRAAFVKLIKEAATAEMQYLQIATSSFPSALGAAYGFNSDNAFTESTDPAQANAAFAADMKQVYLDLGMTEAEAVIAASGR